MNKVSIAVPVYNIEKYLSKCLDSIIGQTYKNLEIILVDDGSPDSSGKICDEYAEKDNRIKVIHKENAGAAEARNTGIKESTGDYIAFIDSDDTIDSTYVEYMLNRLIEDKSELCVCGIKDEYINQNYSIERITDTEGMTYLSPSDAIYKMECQGMVNSSCNKLYKTEIIKKNNIIFDKSVTPGEDLVFNCRFMLYVSGVSFVSKALYHYMKTDEGSLVSRHRPDLYTRVSKQQIYRKEMYDFWKMYSEKEKICFANMYTIDIFCCVPNMYRKESKITAASKKEFFAELQKNTEFLENLAISTDESTYMHQFKKLINTKTPSQINRIYSVLFFLRNSFNGIYVKLRKKIIK